MSMHWNYYAPYEYSIKDYLQAVKTKQKFLGIGNLETIFIIYENINQCFAAKKT